MRVSAGVVALALCVACSTGVASAGRPAADPDLGPALSNLRHKLDALIGLHDIGESERRQSEAARAGYEKRPLAPRMRWTADPEMRDRLLDLKADEYMLRRLHKYDPRTWVGSKQRMALFAEFDQRSPGNHRSGVGLRRAVDELRANVFVLEEIHR